MAEAPTLQRGMVPRVSLRAALDDPLLLGHALAGDSWRAWRVLLLALMGEVLTEDERAIFEKLTKRTTPPGEPVSDAAFVVGRRGGKTKALGCFVAYVACLCDHPSIVSGETARVLLIAQDMDQAGIALDYIHATIQDSPALSQLIASRSGDVLKLTNGIEIEVKSPSFRRLRGRTAICIIADESAFWLGEDRSTNPDGEIITACRPMLLTTGGPLLMASSAYVKKGVLYEAWKRDYGPDGDPRVLVAWGTSTDLHPTLPVEIIERELARDPEKARAEYLSEWRSDLESFVARETIESCVDIGVRERPFVRQFAYHAFLDAAGGSGSDSYALCIAHREGERVILDVIREARPPFSPADITADYCALLKDYHITSARADAYAGDWVTDEFRRHNIHLLKCEQNKSQLYRDALPLFNTGRIALLDNQRLIGQLCGLERRVRFGGRGESVDHPQNGHDDLANVCAGAAVFADRGQTRPRRATINVHEGVRGREVFYPGLGVWGQ